MAESPDVGFSTGETRMESFWLPPGAIGNGLAACRWAEMITVGFARATELLDAFRVAGVPARMVRRSGAAPRVQDTRVWVDPDRYAEAENVLLHEMSRDDRRPSRQAFRAAER